MRSEWKWNEMSVLGMDTPQPSRTMVISWCILLTSRLTPLLNSSENRAAAFQLLIDFQRVLCYCQTSFCHKESTRRRFCWNVHFIDILVWVAAAVRITYIMRIYIFLFTWNSFFFAWSINKKPMRPVLNLQYLCFVSLSLFSTGWTFFLLSNKLESERWKQSGK